MLCLMRPWGHMHYHDRGPKDAPAIVMVNSLGTDLRMWDGVADLLAGYRILRFDKPGHGLSATPQAGWTIGDLARDVLALMDHAGVARAAVAGCSVGGMVAQAAALEAPDRVAALILSNTAAQIGTADSWQARIAAVTAGGVASLAEAVLDRWFPAPFRHSDQALPWLTMLQRCDAQGYIGTCRVLAATDLRAGVTGLALPVLMLAGSEDQATPPDLVRETAGMIPGARLVVLPGSGHLPAIDAPEATATLIRDFLKEVGHV